MAIETPRGLLVACLRATGRKVYPINPMSVARYRDRHTVAGRAHYDRRRDDGDRHAAAQRNLSGRLLGCLWHCLATGSEYDEATAFPTTTKKISQAA